MVYVVLDGSVLATVEFDRVGFRIILAFRASNQERRIRDR